MVKNLLSIAAGAMVIYALSIVLASTQVVAKPLFDSKVPINAVLSAPISSTYAQRKKDVRLYFDGSLSYKNQDGSNSKIPVKIKTRGNFRRLNCSYPPLRLNFSKKNNWHLKNENLYLSDLKFDIK